MINDGQGFRNFQESQKEGIILRHQTKHSHFSRALQTLLSDILLYLLLHAIHRRARLLDKRRIEHIRHYRKALVTNAFEGSSKPVQISLCVNRVHSDRVLEKNLTTS